MPSSIRAIDLNELSIRGFRDYCSLTDEEKFVFLVMRLEVLMEMEGWDDFFTNSRDYFEEGYYLQRLKKGLRDAGDVDSAEIIEDYERHLREHGVSMAAHEIDAYLSRQDTPYFHQCRDWTRAFVDIREQRWDLIESHLRARGIELLPGFNRGLR